MIVMLDVYVTPRSGRDEIAGWRGSELSVRVTAPPEGGKANAAVCGTVAAALRVPKTSVRVKRGGTSRRKRLEIEGITEAEVGERLGGRPGR